MEAFDLAVYPDIRKAIDTNQVFIDGLKVPLEDRIGEEGKGFRYLLHGLNPERVLVAAEAVGIGRVGEQCRRDRRIETHHRRQQQDGDAMHADILARF